MAIDFVVSEKVGKVLGKVPKLIGETADFLSEDLKEPFFRIKILGNIDTFSTFGGTGSIGSLYQRSVGKVVSKATSSLSFLPSKALAYLEGMVGGFQYHSLNADANINVTLNGRQADRYSIDLYNLSFGQKQTLIPGTLLDVQFGFTSNIGQKNKGWNQFYMVVVDNNFAQGVSGDNLDTKTSIELMNLIEYVLDRSKDQLTLKKGTSVKTFIKVASRISDGSNILTRSGIPGLKRIKFQSPNFTLSSFIISPVITSNDVSGLQYLYALANEYECYVVIDGFTISLVENGEPASQYFGFTKTSFRPNGQNPHTSTVKSYWDDEHATLRYKLSLKVNSVGDSRIRPGILIEALAPTYSTDLDKIMTVTNLAINASPSAVSNLIKDVKTREKYFSEPFNALNVTHTFTTKNYISSTSTEIDKAHAGFGSVSTIGQFMSIRKSIKRFTPKANKKTAPSTIGNKLQGSNIIQPIRRASRELTLRETIREAIRGIIAQETESLTEASISAPLLSGRDQLNVTVGDFDASDGINLPNITPYLGKNGGIFFPAGIGKKVVVDYIDNDRSKGIIVGYINDGISSAVEFTGNNIVIKHESGGTIIMDGIAPLSKITLKATEITFDAEVLKLGSELANVPIPAIGDTMAVGLVSPAGAVTGTITTAEGISRKILVPKLDTPTP